MAWAQLWEPQLFFSAAKCFRVSMLFVFLEIVLFPDSGFCLLVLVSEIGFEAGTKVDVPTPEPTQDRLLVPVVMRS